jgi:signal transduction histidine kinase
VATALERVIAGRRERGIGPRSGEGPPKPFLLGGVLALGAIALSIWSLVSALTGTVTEAGVVRGLVAVAWALAGALLVRKEASRRIGLVALCGAALGGAAGIWETLRPFAAGLLPAAGLHLLLVFPERFRTRGRFVTAVAGYAVGGIVGALLWAARPDYPAWPAGVEIVLALVIGVGASLARYARSIGPARRCLEWLGWSLTVSAGAIIVLFGLRALVDWPPATGQVAAALTIVIPAALVASISGRLNRAIDVVLSTTISLAGLTAVVIAVYLAIVLGLGRVPRDSERTLLVLSMAAAGVAALLYLPAHRRLRDFATRLVYGERSAPDDVIRNFGSRLSRSVPLDELLLQMVESLRKTLGLSSAEVWRASGGTVERTLSDPERGPADLTLTEQEEQTVARAGVSGPAWAKVWLPKLIAGREDADLRVAPITHSGELLGLIVVERPAGEQSFDPTEENTLAELARQVGLTLHNVRLDSALQASLDEVRRQAQALQASRARIVAAGDLQRRRIERNLHDGAQQHLVALAVKVRLIRQLSERDPQRASTMLEELASDVEDTIQELRDLAHGIYPPLLADKGLPEALTSAARRATVPTSVDAAGVGRFAPDAEAAVYFCCLEALQNAAKHAGDGVSAAIRVWQEEGGLLFEVADDGAGFDVRQRSAGAGFTNMSDRLGAIGGSLQVESAPGQGTRIVGTIPVSD